MARECVVDSVYDSGNARIEPGVVAVWVEAINSVATARHEGAAVTLLLVSVAGLGL